MFENLMSQMQEQAAEIKKKLDKTIVEANAENGLVKVSATANKKILSLEISPEILNNKDVIEDLVIVAINKVLEEAEKITEQETGNMAEGLMPDLGSMFGK